MALVGESGSGKSTLGRIAVRLTSRTAAALLIDGEDLTGRAGPACAACPRARSSSSSRIRYASLDPRFTVGRTLAEPLQVKGALMRAARDSRRAPCSRAGRPAADAATR